MLPVLKEAGVVDAGGAGLIVIYKGFKMAIDGEEITTELDLTLPKQVPASAMENISTAEIEFGYCTEFFITQTKGVTEETIDHLRDKLMAIGDSLVVVGDPELVKVHVHTNMPGKVLQYALRLGQLSKIKIDNMREQHQSLTGLAPEEEQKPKKGHCCCRSFSRRRLGRDFQRLPGRRACRGRPIHEPQRRRYSRSSGARAFG